MWLIDSTIILEMVGKVNLDLYYVSSFPLVPQVMVPVLVVAMV